MTHAPVPVTRRAALATIAGAAVAAGSGAVAGTMPSRLLLGSITGNDPAGFTRFAAWLGRKPDLALLAFNQMSPEAFAGSIPYICSQARLFAALGARILWSVPFPGPKQLEAVDAGTHDAAYKKLFAGIVAASPGRAPILVRLPWEFNLAGQQTAAMDATGGWNGPLFVKAWTRLAGLARAASPRIHRIWCPNVATHEIDPMLCWPGAEQVEIVAQDFYMRAAYNKPGDFDYFLNEKRGLGWGAKFAAEQGKRYGLSEWGMDDDRFVPDFNKAVGWLKGLGPHAHHQCWWDRPEEIDSRISDKTHPALAAAYKAAFAR